MATIQQIFKKRRFFKKKLNPILPNRPQIKGVVLKVRITTPRKPNSARRPVVKALLSNRKQRVVHIPGKGHNLSCIRGVYDLSPVSSKLRRRSIYGLKRPDILKKKLRRRFRVL